MHRTSTLHTGAPWLPPWHWSQQGLSHRALNEPCLCKSLCFYVPTANSQSITLPTAVCVLIQHGHVGKLCHALPTSVMFCRALPCSAKVCPSCQALLVLSSSAGCCSSHVHVAFVMGSVLPCQLHRGITFLSFLFSIKNLAAGCISAVPLNIVAALACMHVDKLMGLSSCDSNSNGVLCLKSVGMVAQCLHCQSQTFGWFTQLETLDTSEHFFIFWLGPLLGGLLVGLTWRAFVETTPGQHQRNTVIVDRP